MVWGPPGPPELVPLGVTPPTPGTPPALPGRWLGLRSLPGLCPGAEPRAPAAQGMRSAFYSASRRQGGARSHIAGVIEPCQCPATAPPQHCGGAGPPRPSEPPRAQLRAPSPAWGCRKGTFGAHAVLWGGGCGEQPQAPQGEAKPRAPGPSEPPHHPVFPAGEAQCPLNAPSS